MTTIVWTGADADGVIAARSWVLMWWEPEIERLISGLVVALFGEEWTV